MKNLCKWFLLSLILVIGVTSCEDVEDFEQCPEITVDVTNVPGSVVYRFAAQLEGIEDVRLLWTIDGEEVDAGNLDAIADQILDYKFEPGTYNVCVKVANEDCPIEVCKEIEVIRDDTNPCPDLFFEARQKERPSHYKFIADFEGVERISYGWYINDELVEDSNPNEDNYLFWEFEEPGRYEVCIKTETPECPEGVAYCKVIEVKEVDDKACPEVYFEKEMEPGTTGTYTFEAAIEGNTEGAELKWYINDERIEQSTDPEDGARVLTYQFEPGVYEVCLKVFTTACPDGVVFCKEIRVGEDTACPEPFFSRDGDYLYADFEGRDTIEWYGWYVNGEGADDEHLNENRDNKFSLENLEAGTYEICILYETPECPTGAEFCKRIVIEREAKCPELSFEAEQDGDNPAYNFYPRAFEGMDDVALEWFVNDEYVGRSSDDPNTPFYYQFSPGSYQVCLKVETPDCPNGTEFCKEIKVE